jgi:hypothetical protein
MHIFLYTLSKLLKYFANLKTNLRVYNVRKTLTINKQILMQIFAVRWCDTCHNGMARPQVADGGDGLQS